MEIKYGKQFEDEAQRKFGIRPSYIEDVVACPDKKEEIKLEGEKPVTLTFYLKKITVTKKEHFLVVFGSINGNTYEVFTAYKVPAKLIYSADDLRPHQYLQILAKTYGLNVCVGDIKDKFIFSQTIPAGDNYQEKMFSVENPENHDFAAESMVMLTEKNGEKVFICALAFAIDLNVYLKDI